MMKYKLILCVVITIIILYFIHSRGSSSTMMTTTIIMVIYLIIIIHIIFYDVKYRSRSYNTSSYYTYFTRNTVLNNKIRNFVFYSKTLDNT